MEKPMPTMTIKRREMGRKIKNAPEEWKWTEGKYLHATAELRAIGDQAPYFSVTGEVWDSEAWRRRGVDGRNRAGGMLHDLILSQFPELAPVVRVHLAREDGTPLHAEANGWYWYSDYDGRGASFSPGAGARMTPHERAANTLRLAPSELPTGMSRDEFSEFVAGLADRWSADADAALAVLDSDD